MCSGAAKCGCAAGRRALQARGLPSKMAVMAIGTSHDTGKRARFGLVGAVMDFLLPARCVTCGDQLMQHAALCAACWSQLDLIDAPRCDVYGTPLPFDSGGLQLSATAVQRPPEWHRARAAVKFDDHSRRLVHALKYHDRHEVVQLMVRMMMRCGSDILQDADFLVPVPLYYWRMWGRRFNQAALLADKISRSVAADYRPDILTRQRPTRSQVGLSADARRDNVKGAFTCAKDRAGDLYGRRLVLVDDVLTTGATAEACARALKSAGAQRVDVLTFALVPGALRSHL